MLKKSTLYAVLIASTVSVLALNPPKVGVEEVTDDIISLEDWHCDRPFEVTARRIDMVPFVVTIHTERCVTTDEVVAIGRSVHEIVADMPLNVSQEHGQSYVDQQLNKQYNNIFIQQ